MLQPPVSDLAPWRPGHWITQTGYALNEDDVVIGVKKDKKRQIDMIVSVREVDSIIQKGFGK
jgi:hypothetical protein